MRDRGCSSYPELFSQPDKSKRAKKMLELAILSLLGLDESKANKLTLEPILSCFHGLDESQIAFTLSRSYSTRMRAKELKRCFSSPIPSLFRLR
jgi:hypothetical protein